MQDDLIIYEKQRLVDEESILIEKIVDNGILAAIGNTPLVKIINYLPTGNINLYLKLEYLNPGGSVKDRSALSMIVGAIKRGDIGKESTLVESSSGNLGIGVAQACRVLGIRFICVVDPRTTKKNIDLLKVYGAEVDMVGEPSGDTTGFLAARIKRVKEHLQKIPGSYSLDQYRNLDNAGAHYHTIREIISDLEGNPPDYLFCAASSCGTIRGCADYIHENNLATRVIGVDAIGSVIFGGEKGPRLIPGHGAAVVPELLRCNMVFDHQYVSDLDCVIGCRRLLNRESILAGGSSGGVIYAVESWANKIPEGSTCVALLADRGERYLDTIYDDEWVSKNLGKNINEYWT